MSQHMIAFTFGSQSMNTMPMSPAEWNVDATAFQHTGTLYILWLTAFLRQILLCGSACWGRKMMNLQIIRRILTGKPSLSIGR